MSNADPADRLEQELPVADGDGDLPSRITDVDLELPEADALEQALAAGGDPDDDRR